VKGKRKYTVNLERVGKHEEKEVFS